MLNFGNGGTEFPLPSSATRVWSAQSEKEKKKKLTNELWQCHCRNRGIKFFLAIVTMALPKMGGGGGRGSEIYGRVKKKRCHVHNVFTTFSQ